MLILKVGLLFVQRVGVVLNNSVKIQVEIGKDEFDQFIEINYTAIQSKKPLSISGEK